MAEPENFDDDLFADLYDDNEAPGGAPPTAAPAQAAPAPAAAPTPSQISYPQPSIEAPGQPEFNQAPSDIAPVIDENGYGDDYQDENYEDDDDVDFNLGNGPAAGSSVTQSQQEVSTPTFHSTRGPSAKEDGRVALQECCYVSPILRSQIEAMFKASFDA
ncbi:hypothetical protein AAE478_006839 [Parahypoxylon ruwenzoriense]